jgi:hypothetical protein
MGCSTAINMLPVCLSERRRRAQYGLPDIDVHYVSVEYVMGQHNSDEPSEGRRFAAQYLLAGISI